MPFFYLYLMIFLAMTWMLWLPVFLFSLPTVFLPAYYIFNYTSLMNPVLKIFWVTFFEIMARFQKKKIFDDKRHRLSCMNTGYADLFETKNGEVYVKRGNVPNNMDKFRL